MCSIPNYDYFRSTDNDEYLAYMLSIVLEQGMFEVECRLLQVLRQGLQKLVAERLVWHCTERLHYEECFYNICI